MTETAYSILAAIAKNADDDPKARALNEKSHALNSLAVKNAKGNGVPQQLPDGGGLLLFISPTGAKSWRYRFRIAGKGQTLTIGSYPEVGLADARKAHRGARWLVERGIHPKEHVDAEIARSKAANIAAEASTFRALWNQYNEATAPNLAPRTLYNRDSWMKKHILPIIGDKHVDQITRRELADMLTRIDRTYPATAKHCLGLVKQVLDAAADRDLIPGNPSPKASVLINQRGRKDKPHRALPVSRLGRFLVDLSNPPGRTDPLTKAALHLLVLTWVRSAEVVGAEWAEFDFDAAVWRIPAERMKGREPHTVYLSNQAVKLLRDLALLSHGRLLFPNRHRPGEAHMDRGTLRLLRDRMGYTDVDIHGFRAVASTWANESGKFRPDVIEAALAHKEQDRIRAAYNRAQFTDELRTLWQAWADFMDEREAIERGLNVIQLETRKAG